MLLRMCGRGLWPTALVAAAAGCGSVTSDAPDGSTGTGADAASEPDAARPDGSSAADVVLRYDFDDGLLDDGGARFVPDVGGGDRRGVVLGAASGESMLEVVAREGDAGNALRWPGECQEPEPSACPRVILEAEDSADQDPGERDFAVTLDFLVPSLPDGSSILDQNVIQKGNFDDPGQWKIEIDSERRPTCVFHYPDDGGTPVTVRIQRAVDDGAWHTVRCERRGDELRISLDAGEGEDARAVQIPPGDAVDIANAQPIRIGGQNVSPSADQFHGSLDNVSVEMF